MVVCTRTRLDETAIFLQRGPVKRRQGEKRRKKTGRRPQGLARAQGLARTEQAGNEVARIRLEDLTDQLEDFLSRDLGSS